MNGHMLYTLLAACLLASTMRAQYMIVEPGTYVVVEGASLVVQGNLEINGEMSFSQDASLVLTSNQDVNVKGLGRVSNLKVDVYGSVFLQPHDDKRRTIVEKQLELAWGALTIEDGHLVLDPGANIVGGSDTSFISTIGNGLLVKQWNGPGTFSYPLGDGNPGVHYTPAKITVYDGQFSDAEIGLRVVDAKHDFNDSQNHYVKRYWDMDIQGLTSGIIDAEYTYVDTDIIGDEQQLSCARWDGTLWHIEESVDPGTNKLIALDTEAGAFTAGEPNALPLHTILEVASFGITGFYPNPAMGITTINYTLGKPMMVTLALHNQLGERVALIEEGVKNPGLQTTQFSTNSLPSGTYYLRLSSATATKSIKIQIVK